MIFNRSLCVVLLACLVSILSLGVAFATDTRKNASAAKVGSIVISQQDVNRRAQAIMPMQAGFHGSVDKEKIAEIKKKALDELIIRAYKVQYAIDEEISIDAASFESEWQKRLDKNKQTVSKASPLQLSKARAYLYLDALAREAEKTVVSDRVTVSDEDVVKHYSENKEKFFQPKLYTASHIFVRVGPSDSADVKKTKTERAESLYQRAKSGEDFYNLAYYESDDRSKYVGGSLGSFHAGQTVPEFDAAVKSMKVGDVVGPIRTIYGYHVIKLDDLSEERQMELEEVSASIRSDLETAMKNDLRKRWLATLKEKYPVEYFTK